MAKVIWNGLPFGFLKVGSTDWFIAMALEKLSGPALEKARETPRANGTLAF